jgi:hypothetical protein
MPQTVQLATTTEVTVQNTLLDIYTYYDASFTEFLHFFIVEILGIVGNVQFAEGELGYTIDGLPNFSAHVSDQGELIVNDLATDPYHVDNDGFLITGDVLPPPTALPASNITPDGFTANWSTVAGALKYYLDVSTDPQFDTYVAGYQNLDVGTNFNQAVVAPTQVPCYYRVRAYDGVQTSLDSGVMALTPQAIDAPLSLTATTVAENEIDLTWSSDHNVVIYRSTDAVNYSELTRVDAGNEAYQDLTANALNTQYFYKIKAYIDVFYSDYSDVASDWTPMKLILQSNGDGSETARFSLGLDSGQMLVTIDGTGKFYNNSLGTVGEATNHTFSSPGYANIYVKVPSGTATILFYHKGNFTDFGRPALGHQLSFDVGYQSYAANAPVLSASLADFAPSIKTLGLYSANGGGISGNLSDISQSLTDLYVSGYSTITGDISSLSNTIESLVLIASGNITGNVSDIPSSLWGLALYSANTITGDVAGMHVGNLEKLVLYGSNTISGDVADFPQGKLNEITIQGSNTLSGDIAGFDYSSPVLVHVDISGNNTITGDVVDIASSITYISLYGANTVSGHAWSATLRNIAISGANTIDGNITDLPANLIGFLVEGYNTITGNIANIPGTANNFFVTGNNTISGSIANLSSVMNSFIVGGNNTISGSLASMPRSISDLRIEGSNTISGNLSDMPSGAYVILITGANTVAGSISDIGANINTFWVTGNNTISGYTAGHVFINGFGSFVFTCNNGSGFTATKVDNLLIDLNNSLGAVYGFTPQVRIDGSKNAARTSASDAAVAGLTAKNRIVTTN